jgi:hypothetical protein
MTQFNQFVSTIKRNGVAKSSHFFCNVIPPVYLAQSTSVLETIPFYIESVSIPEFALATQMVKDAGLNREAVYDKMYGSVTMTMYSDSNMTIKKFFDDWTMAPVLSKGGMFRYPISYTADQMAIYNVDNAKNVTYVTILNNVYPKIVDDVQLSVDSRMPVTFRVSFTYESWESYQIPQVDPNIVIPGDPLKNFKNAWDMIQLIRSGAGKDAIKSMILNAGTKKVFDIIGKTGIDKAVTQTIDGVIGSSGVGSVIGKLKGIIL